MDWRVVVSNPATYDTELKTNGARVFPRWHHLELDLLKQHHDVPDEDPHILVIR